MPVRNVAAGVVSPLVLLYAWWVLHDARSKGITRLYFLARDGFILHAVAKILAAHWNLNIELRYLYCSRESLLLPSFQEVTEFERYWIPWGYLNTITLEEICRRLNLEESDLDPFLQSGGAAPDLSAPLDQASLARVMDVLATPEVGKVIRKRNQGLYEDAIGYLRQEGLCDDIPYAVVDTGWKGTSQYALSLILERLGCPAGAKMHGYYLGLNKGIFTHKENCLQSFLFDWTRTSRDYRLYNFLCFEMLCGAKHGRTSRYIEANGIYQPEFFVDDSSGAKGILDVHHRSAQMYAGYVAGFLAFDDFPEGSSAFCRSLMRKFISNPDPGEAAAYGDYLIACEIKEGDRQKIAPEISPSDFINVAMGRKRIKGYWPQASFVRSGLKMINFGYGLFLEMKLLDVYRRWFIKY